MSKRPTDTKQRLLDTAVNLFSCHGYCATSIDDILTDVGVTKGAFYHHFKGKDQLCEEVLDLAISQYRELAGSLSKHESGMSRLQQWCAVLIEKQTSGQWLYYRLLMRLSIESAELNSQMAEQLKTFWLWCQHFYETLILETGRFENDRLRASALARVFMAAHFGAAWLDRCAPSAQDLTTVCETVLKLTLQ